jgi:hypothetical protein
VKWLLNSRGTLYRTLELVAELANEAPKGPNQASLDTSTSTDPWLFHVSWIFRPEASSELVKSTLGTWHRNHMKLESDASEPPMADEFLPCTPTLSWRCAGARHGAIYIVTPAASSLPILFLPTILWLESAAASCHL